MPLNVGINNNLVFSKALKNERGTLVIGFKEAGEINPLEALNSGEQVSFKSNEQDILIYPPKLENFENKVDSFENIMNKIAEIVDPLNHILHVYLKLEDVKKGWDMFKGTGITMENLQSKIMTQTTLTKIYDNIVDQFLVMAQPCLDQKLKVRVLLVRTSNNKHYPTLRRRFLESNPFIEPMEVPIGSTKLRFTPWEIKRGLDNGVPLLPKNHLDPTETEVIDSLFKN